MSLVYGYTKKEPIIAKELTESAELIKYVMQTTLSHQSTQSTGPPLTH